MGLPQSKKLILNSVCLFGIDAHDPKGMLRAAEISQKEIEFGDVQIITEHNYFRGREGYSRFCIERMNEFVKTSHVLIIHPDGYVQNAAAWKDEWLQYDYIGATWTYKDGMNNGNGGFSLRSKKLLEILSKIDCDKYNVHPEDCFISRQIRKWLETEYQIKFAPEEVCNQFSIEAYASNMIDSQGFGSNTYTGQFGFHGYHVVGLPEPPIRKTIKFGAPYVKVRRVGV